MADTRHNPIRRRAYRDPVSPELRLLIFERDGGCIAPFLGGSAADCWGRLTIEHVKAELRSSVRAESIPSRMVTLCQGHTEDGRKAGRQWNTTKANRALVRTYLERFGELPLADYRAQMEPAVFEVFMEFTGVIPGHGLTLSEVAP